MGDEKISKKIEQFPRKESHEQVDKSFEVENDVESNVEQQEQVAKQIEDIKFDENSSPKEVASPGGIVAHGQSQLEEEKKKKEIERVLEDDMADFYLKMSPDQQQEFKRRGEETVNAIYTLIDKGKATVKKIVKIIRNWLLIIPGVNKYFLEQEAKLKADEILGLTRKDL